MTIIIDEGVVGHWYVELPDNLGNFIMGLRRDENGDWDITYRFRYYKDNKAHDSADEKSWYKITPGKEEPLETVLASCRMVAASLTRMAESEMIELVRKPGESVAQFMDRFQKMPYASVRKLP